MSAIYEFPAMGDALVRLTAVWMMSGCDLVLQLSRPQPPDASFDTGLCPSTYNVELVGQRSRYRVLDTGSAVWLHSDDCANDRPNATHLASLDDMEEIAVVQAYLNTQTNQPYGQTWVGAVQRPNAVATDDAWITIADGDLPDYWCKPSEPNDGGTRESGIEQFGLILGGATCFIDAPGAINVGALCECDGQPSGTAAAELFEAYRQL